MNVEKQIGEYSIILKLPTIHCKPLCGRKNIYGVFLQTYIVFRTDVEWHRDWAFGFGILGLGVGVEKRKSNDKISGPPAESES